MEVGAPTLEPSLSAPTQAAILVDMVEILILPEASDSTPPAKLWQDGNVDAFFHLVP